MTQYPDLFTALAAPFDEKEVKMRSYNGRNMAYITARTAMNRLDSVLGPENWWDRYVPGENSVLCELSIRLPDGAILTKSDAGGYAGMADSGDDDKSGYSDAFKRACVKFGIARYLYRDGVPSFVRERLGSQKSLPPEQPPVPAVGGPVNGNGHHPNGNGRSNGKQRHSWPGASRAAEPPPVRGGADDAPAPKTGGQLFRWVKRMEEQHQVGLLKYLNSWAKIQGFPGRMVDWNAEEVSAAYQKAVYRMGKRLEDDPS